MARAGSSDIPVDRWEDEGGNASKPQPDRIEDDFYDPERRKLAFYGACLLNAWGELPEDVRQMLRTAMGSQTPYEKSTVRQRIEEFKQKFHP